MRTLTKWITATNSVFGLWLIAAPFVLDAPPVDRWNDIAIGVAIVLLAVFNNREQTRGTVSQLAAGINGILGGWLIVAPFFYGVSGILLWNDVGVGILVTSFAGYNAYAAPRRRQMTVYATREDA